MKWLFIIPGVLVCIVLIVVLIGYLLPVKHAASISVIVNATPEEIWQKLTNVEGFPQWRKNVKKIEVKSSDEWIEITNDNNALPLKVVGRERPTKLVITINSKNLPFGGTWEYKLMPQGNSTSLTIIENGEVYNPVFRFVSNFIMGHTATIKQYAGYLEQSFK